MEGGAAQPRASPKSCQTISERLETRNLLTRQGGENEDIKIYKYKAKKNLKKSKKKSDSWVANSACCIYMSVARQNSNWQSHRRREDSITQQKGKKQQREGNIKKKRALPALFFERPTARKTKEKVTLRKAAVRAFPVPRLTPTPKYSSCSCCVRFLHPPGPHTHI